MRTKLLIGAIGSITIGFLLFQGSRIYSSCGYNPIFQPSCSELLSIAETQKLLQTRQNVVREIKRINPGQIGVSVNEQLGCSGKGIIVITHPSERDCGELNKVLQGNTLGVPYKIINI